MTETIQWSDLPVELPLYSEDKDVLVRQSTIGSMQLCEYRVKLEGQEGYLQAVSEPLVFGTCTHHLIAQDLIAGEPRLDLLGSMDEWVEAILQEEYDWSISQIPSPRDFFAEVTTAYRLWRMEVYPQLPEPIATEKEMWLHLGEGKGEDVNYFLRGTPDVVFEGEIMDWKTSGRAWKEGKADYSIQSSLYLALARQHLDIKVRKFTFWIFNKSKRIWEPQETERRVKDINAALISAYDYGYKMETQAYTATPVVDEYGKKKRGWYCSPKYCEAWNICPVKYLSDNVNENEIAVRSWT